MQSRIIVPKGYEAYVFPVPKSARHGFIAVAEPYLTDNRFTRASNTSILLETCNKIGSIYFKPNDYLHVPKGLPLAILKFVKRE